MTKILLVDDVSLFLEIEKTYFKQTDGQITTALTGEEALQLLVREPFHLVYLDVKLPDVDGASCCRLLKEDPATRPIPIVLVGPESERQRCLDAGADDFLPRPISKADFLRIARRLTGLRVRENARLPLNLRVSFRHQDDHYVAYSKDLSKGGMFLKTAAPLPPGARLLIEFQIPTPDGMVPFSARGEVIQTMDASTALGRSPGVGVRFLDLDPENREKLHAFLERMGY